MDMTFASRTFFVLMVVSLFACNGDSHPSFAPGAPKLTLDADLKTLNWEGIAGADKYNLYVKTVEGCSDVSVDPFQTPTQADPKLGNVTSPFSIADYTGCTTCYYAVLAAENEIGESELSIGVGWQFKVGCP